MTSWLVLPWPLQSITYKRALLERCLHPTVGGWDAKLSSRRRPIAYDAESEMPKATESRPLEWRSHKNHAAFDQRHVDFTAGRSTNMNPAYCCNVFVERFIGVCHACGEPASSQCSQCHRYVCNGHTIISRYVPVDLICTPCVEAEEATQKAAKNALRAQQEVERCSFCGGIQGDHACHPKCAICGKFFCPAHGQYDSAMHVKGSLRYWYVWRRCCDHPRKIRFWSGYEKADDVTVIDEN